MKVVAIGGGISGRIVQYFLPEALVLEAQESSGKEKLTLNFGTNYLWEPLEGFNCRKLNIITHVDEAPATEKSVKRYKNKIGKGYENREDYLEQFEVNTVGWEITQLPPSRIQYGHELVEIDLLRKTLLVLDKKSCISRKISYDLLFCSAPLPITLKLCRLQNVYPVETMFKYKPIYVDIKPHPYPDDCIYVNYLSDPTTPIYRTCCRNGQLHTESLSRLTESDKVIFPGKIYEDPLVPKLLEHLRSHDIFPIGRFGKWASDELIHVTYHEVETLSKGLNDGRT
jgi:hypothetical protein